MSYTYTGRRALVDGDHVVAGSSPCPLLGSRAKAILISIITVLHILGREKLKIFSDVAFISLHHRTRSSEPLSHLKSPWKRQNGLLIDGTPHCPSASSVFEGSTSYPLQETQSHAHYSDPSCNTHSTHDAPTSLTSSTTMP